MRRPSVKRSCTEQAPPWRRREGRSREARRTPEAREGGCLDAVVSADAHETPAQDETQKRNVLHGVDALPTAHASVPATMLTDHVAAPFAWKKASRRPRARSCVRRATGAPLGRTCCFRCIGTTSVLRVPIGGSSSTVAVAMRHTGQSRRIGFRRCSVREAIAPVREWCEPALLGADRRALSHEPDEGSCPGCCSTVPDDVDRRRECPDSTSAARQATRAFATRPIYPRSRRSSP
jgi:hypothetical protein